MTNIEQQMLTIVQSMVVTSLGVRAKLLGLGTFTCIQRTGRCGLAPVCSVFAKTVPTELLAARILVQVETAG